MDYKTGFIYEIVYKGKKTYYFLKSDKLKRNVKDATKICDELEKILDISKEKYGNIYEVVREMSIKTIKNNMQSIILYERKNRYIVREKYTNFVLDSDEVVILN